MGEGKSLLQIGKKTFSYKPSNKYLRFIFLLLDGGGGGAKMKKLFQTTPRGFRVFHLNVLLYVERAFLRFLPILKYKILSMNTTGYSDVTLKIYIKQLYYVFGYDIAKIIGE